MQGTERSAGEAMGGFQMPPVMLNAGGAVRRAGFELEFSGLSIADAAGVVRAVFGGSVVPQNTFASRVETPTGAFQVEIDTRFLTDKAYEKPLRALGFDPSQMNTQWLEDALLGAFGTWFPLEIGCPPVRIDALHPLEDLRERLRAAGAKGTRASALNAYGLHINPEVPDLQPATVLRFTRAFMLLYPWLKGRADVNLTRAIAPYIKPFPSEYVRLVLSEGYPATTEALIDDYLKHNPTRHRVFDLLPLLACMDAERVTAGVGADHKVKARPSFHYRLPNCLVDEPDWRLATEWNTWVAVERLANHPHTIRQMSEDYLKADDSSFRPFVDKWPGVLESYMGPAQQEA